MENELTHPTQIDQTTEIKQGKDSRSPTKDSNDSNSSNSVNVQEKLDGNLLNIKVVGNSKEYTRNDCTVHIGGILREKDIDSLMAKYQTLSIFVGLRYGVDNIQFYATTAEFVAKSTNFSFLHGDVSDQTESEILVESQVEDTNLSKKPNNHLKEKMELLSRTDLGELEKLLQTLLSTNPRVLTGTRFVKILEFGELTKTFYNGKNGIIPSGMTLIKLMRKSRKQFWMRFHYYGKHSFSSWGIELIEGYDPSIPNQVIKVLHKVRDLAIALEVHPSSDLIQILWGVDMPQIVLNDMIKHFGLDTLRKHVEGFAPIGMYEWITCRSCPERCVIENAYLV
jgi:hypothetical protein